MTGQRHPYASHPAAAVLADHRAPFWPNYPAVPTRCDCGWTSPACDHPAHLADMLQQAGLLAPGTPLETPTPRGQSIADEERERIMVERYDEPYYYNGDDT